MAHRRMINQDIIDTDDFAKMTKSARYLYYELLIRADDDGFLGAPLRVVRMVECSDDDLNELINNGYIIKFKTGIIVIRDWKLHNSIRKDIYHKTRYQEEFNMLCEVDKRYYLKECYNVTDNVTYNVTDSVTNSVTLDKYSIDKYSIDKYISSEPDKPTLNQSGIMLPLNDKSLYEVPQENIDTWVTAYPAVDVMHELQKMRAWLESNPTRLKTRRGIKRFINSWLSKEQDRGFRRKQYADRGTDTRQQGAKNSFNNFLPNDYDMDELEKNLLSN